MLEVSNAGSMEPWFLDFIQIGTFRFFVECVQLKLSCGLQCCMLRYQVEVLIFLIFLVCGKQIYVHLVASNLSGGREGLQSNFVSTRDPP